MSTTPWQHEEKCVRGVWEGRCAVKGCDHITRLEGDWTKYPQTPRFFHMASGRNGDLDGGWMYFHRGYLSYRASPKVYYDSMLLCPDHVQAWKDYCDAMDAWDKGVQADRKTWWQTVMVSITAPFRPPAPPKPPMPTSPFEPSTGGV